MARIPHDAFMYYFSLGSDRSYQAVAKKYKVSKRTVCAAAKAEKWQEKVADLEQKAREATEQKAVETLEAMNIRHLKSIRVIQGKALEALKNMSLSTAWEAARALSLSIKEERLIMGEPTDRNAVRVEDLIRREYDRWLVNASDEEETTGDDADDTEAAA